MLSIVTVCIADFSRFCVYVRFAAHPKHRRLFCGILNCTNLSKTNHLPTDQQEALRKTNTERLRIMAAKTYHVGDEALETMDRTALLDVVDTDTVARRGATSRRRSEKSDQVREMELQLELKRMELESKRIEAKTVNRRREAETELENKRLELQNEREKREHELRRAEAGAHKWDPGVHGWRPWQIA